MLRRSLCAVYSMLAVLALAAEYSSAANRAATLESPQLTVQLDTTFPRIIEYRWTATAAALLGQPQKLTKLLINDKPYVPQVTFAKKDAATAEYTLKIAELDVVVTLDFQVRDNMLLVTIPAITGPGDPQVRTLAIPDGWLLSLAATEPGAAVAMARLGVGGDQREVFEKLADKKLDKQSDTWTYVMLNSDRVAATIVDDSLQAGRRLAVQTIAGKASSGSASPRATGSASSCATGSASVTAVWCPRWTWREVPNERMPTPETKIVLTGDRNGDGVVDWQDAALAYRAEARPPMGAALVPDRVSSMIAMNFASWAQHPFLRVLDDMKKVYLYTDGLNQEVQFKGYQSEGHDSSHPDYGGNVNRRAGGVDELNFVMKRALDFHVRSGIHINATEYHPEAKHFSLDLVNLNSRGWAWLDQSYYTDRHYDITSGKLYQRLNEMRRDLPYLQWVYVDVYFGDGWDAYKLAHKMNSLGLPIYTEFEGIMDRYVTWSHRSQDWTQRIWGDGLNSRIARFIQNHQKDVWTHDPLLRGSQNDGFLGWHSQRSLPHMIRSIFTVNLPSKYLQHFLIQRLNERHAQLDDGVTADVAADGTAEIRRHGKLLDRAVYKKDHQPPQDNLVFIPWQPKNPDRVYHWNDRGGKSTWDVPTEWSEAKSVTLYELTDLGRVEPVTVPVVDGRVTLDVKAATPYVLYKDKPFAYPEIVWGEGSPVKDPGFDSHGFKYWKPWSEFVERFPKHIQIVNDENGQTHLQIHGHDGATGAVHQTLQLEPNQWYRFSSWVEIAGQRLAEMSVNSFSLVNRDGRRGSDRSAVRIAKTDVVNYSDNSDKYLTHYQRITTNFQAPTDGKVWLRLLASAGDPDSSVSFDDVRVVKIAKPDMKGHTFFEDFENVDEGWGPFVYGYQGSMRTHLSETHKPFTDDTIDGQYSLKTFDEADELNFRSLPALLPLKPNTRYRLAFDYLTRNDRQYTVAIRSDEGGEKSEILSKPLPGKDLARQHFVGEFTTGAHADYFVGFWKHTAAAKPPKPGKPDKNAKKTARDDRAILVIDNFAVDELGPK
jgi:endo-alpha-N-acetylgalactosaminidase